MTTKITCTGPCGEAKDPDQFYGKSKKCKTCTLARQKALKEAKSKGVTKRAHPTKAKQVAKRAAPPVGAARLQFPASLGFAVRVDEDDDTHAINVVIEQGSASGDVAIWLTPVEESQLFDWLAARRRKAP